MSVIFDQEGVSSLLQSPISRSRVIRVFFEPVLRWQDSCFKFEKIFLNLDRQDELVFVLLLKHYLCSTGQAYLIEMAILLVHQN